MVREPSAGSPASSERRAGTDEQVVLQDRAGRIRRGRSVSRRRRSRSFGRSRATHHDLPLKDVGRSAQIALARRTPAGAVHSGPAVRAGGRRARASGFISCICGTRAGSTTGISSTARPRRSSARISRHGDRRAPPPSRPLEIRVGTAYRDDRDVSLHPAARLQRRARHRRRCCATTSTI